VIISPPILKTDLDAADVAGIARRSLAICTMIGYSYYLLAQYLRTLVSLFIVVVSSTLYTQPQNQGSLKVYRGQILSHGQNQGVLVDINDIDAINKILVIMLMKLYSNT
jgi:hypothetical protein